MGTGTTNPTASGTMFALPEGFASNDGVITENNENLNGRMITNLCWYHYNIVC